MVNIFNKQPTLGVDRSTSALLYCILCPVGSYFATGTFEAVSLMADPKFVRAAKGGFGAYKLGRLVVSFHNKFVVIF